jgi:HNH endonuclease
VGVLDDPYSGARIEFRKAQADEVQIDHVVPLAYAWDMGASAWTLEARMAFASSQALNLVAVVCGRSAIGFG